MKIARVYVLATQAADLLGIPRTPQVEKKTFAEEVNEAFREAARGASKVPPRPSRPGAAC